MGLCGALALAACSSGESGNNSSDKSGAAMTGGGQDQSTSDNLSDDPQNSVAPIAVPSPKAITAIPAAFQGRWGEVVNDCDRAQPGPKGLIVISGADVIARGGHVLPTSLAMIGADTLIAELSYAIPGPTARRANRLTLVENGRTLVRQEQNPAASFRYSRCPA
jgi:hypothetical protein